MTLYTYVSTHLCHPVNGEGDYGAKTSWWQPILIILIVQLSEIFGIATERNWALMNMVNVNKGLIKNECENDANDVSNVLRHSPGLQVHRFCTKVLCTLPSFPLHITTKRDTTLPLMALNELSIQMSDHWGRLWLPRQLLNKIKWQWFWLVPILSILYVEHFWQTENSNM